MSNQKKIALNAGFRRYLLYPRTSAGLVPAASVNGVWKSRDLETRMLGYDDVDGNGNGIVFVHKHALGISLGGFERVTTTKQVSVVLCTSGRKVYVGRVGVAPGESV